MFLAHKYQRRNNWLNLKKTITEVSGKESFDFCIYKISTLLEPIFLKKLPCCVDLNSLFLIFFTNQTLRAISLIWFDLWLRHERGAPQSGDINKLASKRRKITQHATLLWHTVFNSRWELRYIFFENQPSTHAIFPETHLYILVRFSVNYAFFKGKNYFISFISLNITFWYV